MTEPRPVAELDAALAAARGAAGRAWQRVSADRPWRNDACRRTVELREARARAEHRDQVDRDIADLEAQMVGAASIGAGDSGAVIVSATLSWLTRAVVHPSERDIQRVRVLGLTLLPACGGLLLGLAMQAARMQWA